MSHPDTPGGDAPHVAEPPGPLTSETYHLPPSEPAPESKASPDLAPQVAVAPDSAPAFQPTSEAATQIYAPQETTPPPQQTEYQDPNGAPQYQAPQSPAPGFPAPQHQAPQYQAPQYQAPLLVRPAVDDPQAPIDAYGQPAVPFIPAQAGPVDGVAQFPPAGQLQPEQLQPEQLQPEQLQPGQLQPGQLQPGQLQPGQLQPGQLQPGQFGGPGGYGSTGASAAPARRGKALTMVIAGLAVLFLIAAGAFAFLYMGEMNKVKKQADTVTARNTTIANQVGQLTALQQQVTAATAENTSLKADNTTKDNQLTEAQHEKAVVATCVVDINNFFTLVDRNASTATINKSYDKVVTDCEAADQFLN